MFSIFHISITSISKQQQQFCYLLLLTHSMLVLHLQKSTRSTSSARRKAEEWRKATGRSPEYQKFHQESTGSCSSLFTSFLTYLLFSRSMHQAGHLLSKHYEPTKVPLKVSSSTCVCLHSHFSRTSLNFQVFLLTMVLKSQFLLLPARSPPHTPPALLQHLHL